MIFLATWNWRAVKWKRIKRQLLLSEDVFPVDGKSYLQLPSYCSTHQESRIITSRVQWGIHIHIQSLSESDHYNHRGSWEAIKHWIIVIPLRQRIGLGQAKFDSWLKLDQIELKQKRGKGYSRKCRKRWTWLTVEAARTKWTNETSVCTHNIERFATITWPLYLHEMQWPVSIQLRVYNQSDGESKRFGGSVHALRAYTTKWRAASSKLIGEFTTDNSCERVLLTIVYQFIVYKQQIVQWIIKVN